MRALTAICSLALLLPLLSCSGDEHNPISLTQALSHPPPDVIVEPLSFGVGIMGGEKLRGKAIMIEDVPAGTKIKLSISLGAYTHSAEGVNRAPGPWFFFEVRGVAAGVYDLTFYVDANHDEVYGNGGDWVGTMNIPIPWPGAEPEIMLSLVPGGDG